MRRPFSFCSRSAASRRATDASRCLRFSSTTARSAPRFASSTRPFSSSCEGNLGARQMTHYTEALRYAHYRIRITKRVDCQLYPGKDSTWHLPPQEPPASGGRLELLQEPVEGVEEALLLRLERVHLRRTPMAPCGMDRRRLGEELDAVYSILVLSIACYFDTRLIRRAVLHLFSAIGSAMKFRLRTRDTLHLRRIFSFDVHFIIISSSTRARIAARSRSLAAR